MESAYICAGIARNDIQTHEQIQRTRIIEVPEASRILTLYSVIVKAGLKLAGIGSRLVQYILCARTRFYTA